MVVLKYFILVYNNFKTKKTLFKANIYQFILFLMVVIAIEYGEKIKAIFPG